MSQAMIQERLYKIILRPHISEKATNVADSARQFVFRVAKDATKPEVKAAIEALFKVKVKAVRICNTSSKPKRQGQLSGRTKAWKKAYVALEQGFDIDFAISS